MTFWRGHTLTIEPSHVVQGHAVIRCPITLKTLHSHPSRKAAENYCRRNGYSWMEPVRDVDTATLEERI